MTVGIRVRGTAGNVQIDDTTPVFVVGEQGTVTPAHFVYGGWGMFKSRSVVTFAQAVRTQAPPLIFLRFITAYTVMVSFSMTGSPGNWTGFSFGAGTWGQNLNLIMPAAITCDWFSGMKTPGPSGAKVGIRIRNRKTGEVVFDSGFKLVKFIQQNADFKSEGRLTHWVLRYSVGIPSPDAYFLANTLSGVINYYQGEPSVQFMSPSVDSGYPNKLLLYTWSSSRGVSIPYQRNLWTVLFATPGL